VILFLVRSVRLVHSGSLELASIRWQRIVVSWLDQACDAEQVAALTNAAPSSSSASGGGCATVAASSSSVSGDSWRGSQIEAPTYDEAKPQ